MAGIKNPYRSEEANRLFKAPEYKVINGKTIKYSDVIVHEFIMGDVEDPDLYAAQPLWDWQQTEAGQWVMAHSITTPFWHRMTNPYYYGLTYYVVARLAEQDQTYWTLKWKK
jgi:hypothetical protein